MNPTSSPALPTLHSIATRLRNFWVAPQANLREIADQLDEIDRTSHNISDPSNKGK